MAYTTPHLKRFSHDIFSETNACFSATNISRIMTDAFQLSTLSHSESQAE